MWHALTHTWPLPDSDPGATTIRPLHAAFEWLVWELLRAHPASQHGVSVALHALVAALVVRVLVAYQVEARHALAGAVLFAAHPVTAGCVGEVSARAFLVATAAFLYAFARASEAKTTGDIFGWTLTGVLGSALAHEGFLFAVVLFAIHALCTGRFVRAGGALLGALLALAVLRPALPPGAWLHVAAAIEVQDLFVILAPPAASSYFTPFDLATPVALAFLSGVIVLAGLASGRRLTLAAVGTSMIVLAPIALAPAAIRGGVASDRGAYVVLLGAVIAVAAVAKHLPATRIGKYLPFVLAVALAPFTWMHERDRHDDTTMLRALAVERSDDPEGKLAAALLTSADRMEVEAYPECAAYLASRPGSTRAHLCAGMGLLAAGDAASAAPLLRRYAGQHPDEERARRGLLTALFAIDALTEARDDVVRWRAVYPKAPDLEAARAELVRRGAW